MQTTEWCSTEDGSKCNLEQSTATHGIHITVVYVENLSILHIKILSYYMLRHFITI